MKPLIVANWKMNPQTLKQAKGLFDLIKKGVKDIKAAEVVICPPFVYLSVLNNSSLKIGSQDCFWEEKGPYTGEISPAMLKDLGCQYVIVGHSERRKYYKETDEMTNKKLKSVLESGLIPILCIGETEEEREKGKIEEILKKQLSGALKNLSDSQIKGLIIAYEPVWAISKGDPYKSKYCDAEEAQKIKLVIRKFISELYNSSFSKTIRIIFGGSANSENAAVYIRNAGFEGLLVGGASLKAEEFIKLVKNSAAD